MHILPDAAAAVPDHVADQFPMGYFFAVLGFLILFLLTRVIAPMFSRGSQHVAGGCCAAPVLPQVTVLYLTHALLTLADEFYTDQCLDWFLGALNMYGAVHLCVN